MPFWSALSVVEDGFVGHPMRPNSITVGAGFDAHATIRDVLGLARLHRIGLINYGIGQRDGAPCLVITFRSGRDASLFKLFWIDEPVRDDLP